MTYFIDRIMGLARFSLRGQTLVLKPLQGERQIYVPVSDRLWRRDKQPVATLALISNEGDSRFIQSAACYSVLFQRGKHGARLAGPS